MLLWTAMLIIGIAGKKVFGQALNPNCDSSEIMKCVSSSNQEGRIFFPDTQQRLREYCRHLMENVQCARGIIDECVGEEDRRIYYNLTHEMMGMNVQLCTPNSPLSNRFLSHVDCYKTVSGRFRTCSDRSLGNIVVVKSLSKEEQMKMTCCTVHEYSHCMRNAVDGRCETDAQKLVEETVLTAMKQSLGYCSQLHDLQTSNCLRSASKGHATGNLEDSGTAPTHTTNSLYLLMSLTIILWVLS